MDSDSDGDLDGADDLDEEEPAAAERALPPFFAAIPSLGGTRPGSGAGAAPPRQQQPGSRVAAPPRTSSQQHAAPATTSQQQGAAADRPQSASAFRKQREDLTAQLFQEFNRTVFEGELAGPVLCCGVGLAVDSTGWWLSNPAGPPYAGAALAGAAGAACSM